MHTALVCKNTLVPNELMGRAQHSLNLLFIGELRRNVKSYLQMSISCWTCSSSDSTDVALITLLSKFV